LIKYAFFDRYDNVDTDTGWRELLERKGLHQAAGILEKYGTGSESNVSDQRGKGRNGQPKWKTMDVPD
jgi:hypothetical protein